MFILIWRLNVEEKLQFLRFRRPTRVNMLILRTQEVKYLVTVVKLFTNSHQCTFRSFSCDMLRTTLSGYAYVGPRLSWT